MSTGLPTIADYIDRAPIRGLLVRTPLLCCLLMLTEGMDTYGVGYVGPFLSKEHGFSPSMLGNIYTGTVIASLIGAVVVAPLSDRFGRRVVLILSSLLMGLCTLLTPHAETVETLFAVRFLIGLGFGAAVPTAFALTADYAPARRRSLIMMMMSSGIALGMVLAGIAAAYIIPAYGWRMLLYVNGVVSLFWTAILIAALPESLRFLMLRRPDSAAAVRTLARLAADRGEPPPAGLRAEEAAPAGNPVRALVRDGRALMTFLLWFIMSAAYSVEFFLSYWLPTVLMNAGADIHAAGLITAAGKAGSLAGAVVIGMAMDRLGAARVLCVTFFLTSVAIVMLGNATGVAMAAAVMVVVACFFLDGSFAGCQAFTAASYPGSIRATGTGWVTGFSRLLGGGSGTLLGGWLVEANWSIERIALVMAVPMLLGSGAFFIIGRIRAVPAAAPACAVIA